MFECKCGKRSATFFKVDVLEPEMVCDNCGELWFLEDEFKNCSRRCFWKYCIWRLEADRPARRGREWLEVDEKCGACSVFFLSMSGSGRRPSRLRMVGGSRRVQETVFGGGVLPGREHPEWMQPGCNAESLLRGGLSWNECVGGIPFVP